MFCHMPGRLLAIRDIHGCSAALRTRLVQIAACSPTPITSRSSPWRTRTRTRSAGCRCVTISAPARQISGNTAIIGHTPQLGGQILNLGYLKCVDTACGARGPLTAVEVTTGQPRRSRASSN